LEVHKGSIVIFGYFKHVVVSEPLLSGHVTRRRWLRRSDWSLHNWRTDSHRILRSGGRVDHFKLDQH